MNKISNSNIVIDVEETLGNVRFKRFDGLVYKYEDRKRTDNIIGFNIIVESLKTYSNYKIKILNTNQSIKSLEENPEKFFDKYIDLKDLKMVPYISNNFINWSISASYMGFKKND